MELWEKEYLENLQERKPSGGVSLGYTKQQKEYINACWEEVTRPDGSKWYIPKQDKIQKRIGQQYRKNNRFVWVKNMIRIVLVVCCFFILFTTISDYSVSENGGSPSHSSFLSSNIIHRFRVHNTMVDGLGLRNMLNTVWDIRDIHAETLNSYVGNDYSFTVDEVEAWMDRIDSDLVKIGTLAHDDSYSEFIGGSILLLNTLKSYVWYVQEENWVLAQAAYAEYASLSSDLYLILAEAFENNGVRYTLDADGITYWYYQY